MASTSSTHQCSISFDSDDFSPEELFVAQILQQLPLLIQKSNFSLGLSPSWPIRRKRSAVDSPPDTPSLITQPPLPPQPCPPSSEREKESSPTTPLSLNSLPLSRSESDENITIAKVSKKKAPVDKKSQYLETIDKLTHQKQALEGDIEAMKRHFINLKTINSELKAKKQEILGGFSNLSVNPEIGTSSSVAMEVAKLTVKSSYSNVENNHDECEPSMKNQTVPTAEQGNSNRNYQIPIGGIPLYDPSLGPMGIPDLNLSLEDIFHKSYTKYLAARARQNRIQIWKNKNNNNNGAPKLQS
ncbi:hypothetical protein IC582_006436 [Cucumis melo]